MKVLIRRYILLPLVGLVTYTQSEAQTPTVADQVYTLDSLTQEATEYYQPQEVTSDTLRQLLASTPSIEAQLIDFYTRGGLDVLPSRSLLVARLMMPRPWLFPSKELMRPRLSIQVDPAELHSLTPRLRPSSEDYRREAALSLLSQFASASVRRYPDRFVSETDQAPSSLALATPSGGSVERALESYVQATQPTPMHLPQRRKYAELRELSWVPELESSIQFSQNRVSDNWYKGGASNLNLYMRNYVALSYIKDRVLWKNELESKLSVYNADKDSVHRYRIADDLLRLRSNYGIRAFNKIYYTLDAELRTQLFRSYRENRTSLQSDLLSPFTLNVGLGLKYDYTKKSTKVYGRSLHFSINVAPISYTYRGTSNRDIDLARHGLDPDKLWYQRFGSTIRANWEWKLNLNLTWSSRFYFNTSYQATEIEWENTLDMALTRYFSTRLNLNLRFDDAVHPAKAWNKYLQYNELLSFGFNYRL